MAKKGLYENIRDKRERIENGSGERMRKPGSKGAPPSPRTDSVTKIPRTDGGQTMPVG